jgi:hypothetical protein
MSRSTEARMKSEVGETREAKIAAMCASGLGAASIQSALEMEYTETMDASDPRRKTLKNAKPFDKIARQRMLEALRSTRRLMMLEDAEADELVAATAGEGMGSIEATELTNLRRFSCNVPALDYIYGTTHFIWLKDHNQKHPEKGRYRKGQYMPYWMPKSVVERGWVEDEDIDTSKPWVSDHKDAYKEHGLPFAFMSIWPGSPGVGKTRLAIATTKAINGTPDNPGKQGLLLQRRSGEVAVPDLVRNGCES